MQYTLLYQPWVLFGAPKLNGEHGTMILSLSPFRPQLLTQCESVTSTKYTQTYGTRGSCNNTNRSQTKTARA